MRTLYDGTTAGMTMVSFFVAPEYATTSNSMRVRSLLALGAPIEEDKLSKDASIGDKLIYYKTNFFKEYEEAIFSRYAFEDALFGSRYRNEFYLYAGGDDIFSPESQGSPKVRVRFSSEPMRQLEFDRLVNSDLLAAIGSIVVVYLYVWFHTRSGTIASVTLLQIILSLPVAFFLVSWHFSNSLFCPNPHTCHFSCSWYRRG